MRIHPTTILGRLIIYFLIIMFIPLLIFLIFFNYYNAKGVYGVLEQQAKVLIKADGQLIEKKMEEYRHIAYSIGTNELVIDALEDDVLTDNEASQLYTTMYVLLNSDSMHADAHIVSVSGKSRLSSGIFPDEYDTRFQTNEWNRKNIIAEANTRRDLGRASLFFIGDHRVNNDGEQILFSILRNIFSDDGTMLGYVIVDVYTEAVIPELTNGSIFKDVILVDNTLYSAFSLNHPNMYGSFDKFPFLRDDSIQKYYYYFPSGLFYVVGYIDTTIFKGSSERLFASITIALLLGTLVSIILSIIFSHSLSKRINNMIKNMKYIEEGNLNIYLEETGIVEFNELAASFNTMITKIIYLIQSRSEEAAKAAEAERKALESQLNPHFIFNTLNTIKALAKLHNETEIYTISLQLGKLLRSSLKNHSSTCLLSESIELTKSYLAIQKIRFSDRLTYTIETHDTPCDTILTPKLIIQPLVENAVVHGLEPGMGGVTIEIDIKKVLNNIYISIKDNGCGMDNPELFNDMSQLEDSGHVGIYNIYRRLQLRYGNNFTFEVKTGPNEGFKVNIVIPVEEDKNGNT